MLYDHIYDSHVHSDNSFDACHSVMFLCENAVQNHVDGLCITDHCEMLQYQEEDYARRIEQSYFDAIKARTVFNGRLSVTSGIELSDMLHDEALTLEVISAHEFDAVLASQHNTMDGTDIYYSDFREWAPSDIHSYLESYFGYLYRLCKWDKHDILAHLTYPLRYIQGKCGIPVDLSRYADAIDMLLRETAQRGKALELNTAGLLQEIQDTAPPFSILKRFRELGGEFVTIGSDAHSADSLGQGISSGMLDLARAGFTRFAFYKQRQPLLMPID